MKKRQHQQKIRCEVCAEMYQVVGTIDVVADKAKILDQLSASAQGKKLPHKTLLPYNIPS